MARTNNHIMLAVLAAAAAVLLMAAAPATATSRLLSTATATATTAALPPPPTTTTTLAADLLSKQQQTLQALAAADPQFDPTKMGPCPLAATPPTATLQVDPAASGCSGGGCNLTVTVTARGPAPPSSSSPPLPARCTTPPPVILVIAGFSARAFMYAPYARLLASWGYAAVQYEPPLISSFPPLKDAFEGSPAFVKEVLAAATSAAAGTGLDLDATPSPMAVGHSRGGKIAALMLASGAVSTAALLDPVDGGFGALFPANPSAVAALRANPPPAGALVVQAGVHGLCNGAIVGGDSLFWDALVAGSGEGGGPSWRTTLPKAGHGAFAMLGPLQPLAGLICGPKRGGTPEKDVIDIAKTAAVEWVERYWAEKQQSVPAEAAFCGFVASEAPEMTPVEREDGSLVCA